MSQELQARTYKPGHFTCFAISDPKLREVWAADFKDRITHHLLVAKIEPIWEKIFIHDSYACRKMKGTHRAVKKIQRLLQGGDYPPSFPQTREGAESARRKGAEENQNTTPSLADSDSPSTEGERRENLRGWKRIYYLHLDIQGFFTSIDKEILFKIISRKIKNPDLAYLAKMIIFHDPKSNYIIKGDKKLLQTVPSHKSLFGVPDGKGLPIGNYTSQFFANVYLNELDQYAKRVLKCKNYFRYMDDIVILDQDKERLRILIREIDNFLKNNLKLQIHPRKTILQEAGKGIDFLGYIIYPEYTLSRKRVVGNIKMKLKKINAELKECKNKEEIEVVAEKAECVVNSYWGHFKYANCASLKKKIYERHFGELKKCLEEKDGHFVVKKMGEKARLPSPERSNGGQG